MSYATSGLIAATDYNNLAWGGVQGVYTTVTKNVAYVMGVGQGATGYGQDLTAINTVAAAGTVTATQWSGLLTKANQALGHQSGAGAQLTVPTITAGGVITYSSILQAAATTVNTNAALFSAQGVTDNNVNFAVNLGGGGTAGINGSTDRAVTFASAQHARYFFNAGGYLNILCSAVDNLGTGSSASLARMINSMGGVTLYRQTTNSGRTGTGLTLNTNNGGVGYRNTVNGVETVLVAVTDNTSAYTNSSARIAVYGSNSPDVTNGANGSSITFRIGYSVIDKPFNDAINVTLNTRVQVVYPESTYLTTNSWGTGVVS
jgi:hypothetical protein